MELLVAGHGMAWHGSPVGKLRRDGFEWRWDPREGLRLPPIRQTIPGQLPSFLVSPLPEGWLESVLNNPDEHASIRSGTRYTSNISIMESSEKLAALPADILLTRLRDHATGGLSSGRHEGTRRGYLHEGFERNLVRIFADAQAPRLSGIQIKAPMHLSGSSALLPSTGRRFTHIQKPTGTGGFDHLPLIDWLEMRFGSDAGMTIPATSLVNMPDGLPPALLVERFDVRESTADRRLIAFEDLCSVLGRSPHRKHAGSMKQTAHALRALSTDPKTDMSTLFLRAICS